MKIQQNNNNNKIQYHQTLHNILQLYKQQPNHNYSLLVKNNGMILKPCQLKNTKNNKQKSSSAHNIFSNLVSQIKANQKHCNKKNMRKNMSPLKLRKNKKNLSQINIPSGKQTIKYKKNHSSMIDHKAKENNNLNCFQILQDKRQSLLPIDKEKKQGKQMNQISEIHEDVSFQIYNEIQKKQAQQQVEKINIESLQIEKIFDKTINIPISSRDQPPIQIYPQLSTKIEKKSQKSFECSAQIPEQVKVCIQNNICTSSISNKYAQLSKKSLKMSYIIQNAKEYNNNYVKNLDIDKLTNSQEERMLDNSEKLLKNAQSYLYEVPAKNTNHLLGISFDFQIDVD